MQSITLDKRAKLIALGKARETDSTRKARETDSARKARETDSARKARANAWHLSLINLIYFPNVAFSLIEVAQDQ